MVEVAYFSVDTNKMFCVDAVMGKYEISNFLRCCCDYVNGE